MAYPFFYPYQQYQQQMSPSNPMTPPTIHAEIVQVDGEDGANAYPVGAGASQMMIAKDDSAIFVKTASANGQYTLEVFQKRQPKQRPQFDPAEYIRKDEIDSLITEAIRRSKKEVSDDEHI